VSGKGVFYSTAAKALAQFAADDAAIIKVLITTTR
jgi:hypothetical protein